MTLMSIGDFPTHSSGLETTYHQIVEDLLHFFDDEVLSVNVVNFQDRIEIGFWDGTSHLVELWHVLLMQAEKAMQINGANQAPVVAETFPKIPRDPRVRFSVAGFCGLQ